LIAERLLKNKQQLKQNPIELRSDEYLYVPINFVIFQSNYKSSNLKYADILDIICNLNSYYYDSKIRFFLASEPEFAVNQTIYEDPLSNKSIVELTKLKDFTALNIFIT